MFLTNNDQKAWNFCTLKAANATFCSNGILCESFCEGSLAYHTIAVLLLH